jgi:hypothetical protein
MMAVPYTETALLIRQTGLLLKLPLSTVSVAMQFLHKYKRSSAALADGAAPLTVSPAPPIPQRRTGCNPPVACR